MNKKALSGLLASLIAILTAWGLYPRPVPPAPTPTPTATATATPEPTPTATALPTPPLPWLCRLPVSTGKCTWPPTIHPQFQHAVEDAQDKTRHLLDTDGRVLDEGRYVLEVARLLQVAGYCAIQGTTVFDEVWLKNENGFSEHWDIVRADGYPITLYAARCAPAAF